MASRELEAAAAAAWAEALAATCDCWPSRAGIWSLAVAGCATARDA